MNPLFPCDHGVANKPQNFRSMSMELSLQGAKVPVTANFTLPQKLHRLYDAVYRHGVTLHLALNYIVSRRQMTYYLNLPHSATFNYPRMKPFKNIT